MESRFCRTGQEYLRVSPLRNWRFAWARERPVSIPAGKIGLA
jgi:hypothetical protein